MRLDTSWHELCSKKILSLEQLLPMLERARAQQKSIATLNGAFDLLHAGHLYSFYEAAAQADLLVVAVNSDRSVQKYKNPSRPIIPLKERMEMLASLACIDFITWFEEQDPCQLLQAIRPDVHVNGAEYGHNCLEAPLLEQIGAKLHLVERVRGLSTSAIIKKIGTLCD